MTRPRSHALANFLRKLAEEPLPDHELLQRFAEHHDEAAFELLVQRYGPLVRRVCKTLVHDDEVDDVFQATFLLLAQKAGSVRRRDSLGPWLHGVAVRLAQNARRAAQRHKKHEAQAARAAEGENQDRQQVQDLQRAIHEELECLPSQYRAPLILYFLEEKTRDEVSRQLGVPLRTLTRRLNRGRELLRARLQRFGIELGSALLISTLGSAANAAIPRLLVVDTVRGALSFVRGAALVGPAAAAAELARGGVAALAVPAFGVPWIKFGTLLLSAVLLAAGGAAIRWRPVAAEGLTPVAAPLPLQSAPVAETPRKPRPVAVVAGRVLDAAGQPVAQARVEALARRAFAPGEYGLRDECLARAETDEQGAFRLSVPADFPTWFHKRQVALLATAPGHPPTTAIVALATRGADATPLGTQGADTTPLAAEITLRLAAPDRFLRGRLLDPDGRPAAGVRLRVVRLGDVAREPVQGTTGANTTDRAWPRPVVSDPAGGFVLVGIDPVQGAWLQVEDERFAPDTFPLAGREQAPVIQLKRARTIEGQVLAADSGLPLAGVKLTLLDLDSSKFSRLTLADYQGISAHVDPVGPIDGVTDAEGRFQLSPPVGAKMLIEIHPPVDSPYLGVYQPVAWSDGIVRQALTVSLPRGVTVRGRVIDENGLSVAGAVLQFHGDWHDIPEYRSVLHWRERLIVAGADGRFRMTVPAAGPVCILAHGPTHEFRPQAFQRWRLLEPDGDRGRWGWRLPAPTERWHYAHAEELLNMPASGPQAEVQLRLVRGEAIAGRLLGHHGEPVESAVLLCGEKVSPLRVGCALPLPVRNGRYELPGCMPGRVYPVLILDAANRQGAAADLPAGQGIGPDIRLHPCGSVRIRILDATDQPAARKALDVMVLTERSFAATQPPLHRFADAQLASWYDPVHYTEIPQTDADGWLTLPMLIPGVRYRLHDPHTQLQYPEFTVREGEHKHLPDLMLVEEEDISTGITRSNIQGKGR